MSLESLLNTTDNSRKIGISPERVESIKPALRKMFAFWREYPDIFVDFMQHGYDQEKEKEVPFHLYFYQRVNKGAFAW